MAVNPFAASGAEAVFICQRRALAPRDPAGSRGFRAAFLMNPPCPPSAVSIVSLSTLLPGQCGVIRALHTGKAFTYRLEALGFRVGRPVTLIRRALWSGPIQVRLGTTDVMLRRIEAQHIDISLSPSNPTK